MHPALQNYFSEVTRRHNGRKSGSAVKSLLGAINKIIGKEELRLWSPACFIPWASNTLLVSSIFTKAALLK